MLIKCRKSLKVQPKSKHECGCHSLLFCRNAIYNFAYIKIRKSQPKELLCYWPIRNCFGSGHKQNVLTVKIFTQFTKLKNLQNKN